MERKERTAGFFFFLQTVLSFRCEESECVCGGGCVQVVCGGEALARTGRNGGRLGERAEVEKPFARHTAEAKKRGEPRLAAPTPSSSHPHNTHTHTHTHTSSPDHAPPPWQAWRSRARPHRCVGGLVKGRRGANCAAARAPIFMPPGRPRPAGGQARANAFPPPRGIGRRRPRQLACPILSWSARTPRRGG